MFLIFARLHPTLKFVFMGQSEVRGKQMEADDEGLPTEYLLFAVAAIIVIGVAAAGAFIILIRN
jgi:hypothetical protein